MVALLESSVSTPNSRRAVIYRRRENIATVLSHTHVTTMMYEWTTKTGHERPPTGDGEAPRGRGARMTQRSVPLSPAAILVTAAARRVSRGQRDARHTSVHRWERTQGILEAGRVKGRSQYNSWMHAIG